LFGLSHCVDWFVEANISEKCAVSISRAEVGNSPEDGDSTLLQNVGFYQPINMVTQSKRT
jgi:hypothetical protein